MSCFSFRSVGMFLPNSSRFPGHPCLLTVHHPDLISSLHLSVNTTLLTASMQTLQQVLRWHNKARVPAAEEQEDERWERWEHWELKFSVFPTIKGKCCCCCWQNDGCSGSLGRFLSHVFTSFPLEFVQHKTTIKPQLRVTWHENQFDGFLFMFSWQ